MQTSGNVFVFKYKIDKQLNKETKLKQTNSPVNKVTWLNGKLDWKLLYSPSWNILTNKNLSKIYHFGYV